jgi:2-phosphoglycerate kinase
MIYLLGGPPRVGKSIISGTITETRGISSVSTDSLAAVLETVLDPVTETDLFLLDRVNAMPVAARNDLMVRHTSDRIGYQIREGHAVWKGVRPFILAESHAGRDVVVEGAAVLPELVHQLEGVTYRAVFIGNQGPEHNRNIKQGALANAHDWMRDASDEYIDAFAKFVIAMSRYVEAEARRYDFPYVPIDGRPFDDAAAEVANLLLA